jgi:hypothetical protein
VNFMEFDHLILRGDFERGLTALVDRTWAGRGEGAQCATTPTGATSCAVATTNT